MRAPPLRAPSPRQDGPRPYESSRQTPVRKMQSPSPKMQPSNPGMFPHGPQTLPQISMQERPPAFGSGVRPSPTMNGPQQHNANGAGSGSGSTLPPYGRPFSPPNELRPLRDERPHSPGPGFRHQPFQAGQPFPSIGNGVHPVAQPLSAVEGPPRDERPPSALKRTREWETDAGPSKKHANDETRARLDDPTRRGSPPGRIPTPKDRFRRSSSELRRDQERRANENYHPSEAAHHPYSHPQLIPSMQSILDAPKDERKEHIEQAARKVDVDEDYDNNSEDDKQRGRPSAAVSSPRVGGPPPSATPKQEAMS